MAAGRARRRRRYVACRATRVRPDDRFQIPKLPLATGSRNAERLTGSEPARARAICAFRVTNHFWNATALSWFGAETEIPVIATATPYVKDQYGQ